MAAPEVPDWTRPIQLFARGPTGELTPVLVDAAGQLYIVIQGELEGITGNINVVQTEKDREIQGADGATLRTVKVDASGQIIMVPRGQSGNYMLVDADGYLTTVFKGLDGATLRTVVVDASGNIVAAVKGMYGTDLKSVAVDSQGRMIMIPTDPADVWGNAISMGNAELAAILSVAKRYDRRGNVVFVDDFERGLSPYLATTVGDGSTVTLTSDEALAGMYAAKLYHSAVIAADAAIEKLIGHLLVSKIGVETTFRIGTGLGTFEISILYYDGTNYHHGAIRYDLANDKWEYRDSAGTFQNLLTSAEMAASAGLFYPVKLVIDPVNDIYERALICGQEIDMTGKGLRAPLDDTSPHLSVTLSVLRVSTAGFVYVDTLIITQNEPAN